MLKKVILFIIILQFSACAGDSNTSNYGGSSATSRTNVLPYADAEDISLCRGLGFKLPDDLNSCVRARLITKSGMLRSALKSPEGGAIQHPN